MFDRQQVYVLGVSLLLSLSAGSESAWSQRGGALGSLKNVPIPQPSNLSQYVRDQKTLVVLGKALFWDMQAGGDGKLACASCHFHAGADHRAQNQISNAQTAFAVNHTLTLEEFPFHALSDVNSNRSNVLRDRSDSVGSAGLFRRIFTDIFNGAGDDGYDSGDTAAFSMGGVNARRVTARNTPTVINAVFNARNFWDGRASSVFTGFTPFGDSDPAANSLVMKDGQLTPEKVRLLNASLASQAVGPPLNGLEMSYQGRTWPKLGKKMLALRPLALQAVASDDSVLGPYADTSGRGLAPQYSYSALIQAAFQPGYWSSTELVDGTGALLGRSGDAQSTNEFTQTEFNFALIWGLAIQAYEATLVSDDTPFDRFSDGSNNELTPEQRNGLQQFRNAECTTCHAGPEFTLASFGSIAQRGAVQRGGNGQLLDTGFFRTGVRPASEDIGLGGVDDFNRPFSLAVAQNPNTPAVNGAFRTPGLRNVEFTGPFFHNGSQATLAQVVDFYMRGSDFPAGGLGPDVQQRNVNAANRQALVEFMKTLSDDRVRYERAPFDHPELCVPAGHIEASPGVLQVDGSDARFAMSAADRWAGIPAVGAKGNIAPLQTFEELLANTGADGSRAHTLKDACTIQ